MIKTFSSKTKEAVINSQNGYCFECLEPVHSIHHKLSNTKYNRERFPLFIHSPLNAIGLCENCHRNKAHSYRITESQAVIYEEFLKELKDKRK